MGTHTRGSAEHRASQPSPAVVRMRAPETVIPQSERVALLGGLARELDRAPGLITAFTVINSYVALDVVPVKAPEWAVTIGLVYFRGVWWFVYLRSGKAIW